MKNKKAAGKYSLGERLALIIFGVSSSLYILNILIGKASVYWGLDIFHLGNIGEFLLLFAASVSVIVAALKRQQKRRKPMKPKPVRSSLTC